jgi:cobalt-precorrin 5A hydrolase
VERGETMIVAGIGCRKDCPAEDILALLREAMASAGVDAIDLLASADLKANEAGLAQAAAILGRPLRLFSQPALEAVTASISMRSACVKRLTGLESVAEAAALAGAGFGARLIVPRIANARATCALAQGA